MQINQAIENLGNVYRDQVFWEFSEPLANIMEGAIFTVPGVNEKVETEELSLILKDNIQIIPRLHEAFILDNVRVL